MSRSSNSISCGIGILFFIGALEFISCVTGFATTVEKMDVNRLSKIAESVVEARVTEVYCQWNSEHTQIYTYVTLDVSEVYAGKGSVGRTQIRLLGGAVGDTAMIIPGSPRFAIGEHVVLFLHDDPTLYIPIVGLTQGKLNFSVDLITGQEVVGNKYVGSFNKQALESAVIEARERK